MSYELYWISGSPHAWTARLGLEIKGLAYKAHRLDPSKGEHKTNEFLALNPRGKIPVLKYDGGVLYESIAILAFLDEVERTPPLFGTTPEETGEVWKRVFEIVNYIRTPLIDNVARPIFQSKFADTGGANAEIIADAESALSWANDVLGDAQYLAGAGLSAADLVLAPYIQAFIRAIGTPAGSALAAKLLPLEGAFPNLLHWMERIEALPAFEKTYPPHWRK